MTRLSRKKNTIDEDFNSQVAKLAFAIYTVLKKRPHKAPHKLSNNIKTSSYVDGNAATHQLIHEYHLAQDASLAS